MTPEQREEFRKQRREGAGKGRTSGESEDREK